MLTAAYETPEPYSNCARVEPRTNMFVMASLAAGQAQGTVKVRNMSSRGALIEGTALPPEGAECLLHRGDVALEATVVWMKFGKAGIRFHQHADVAKWLPSGRRTQNDVDAAVAIAKAQPAPPAAAARAPTPLFSTELSREDVTDIAAAVEALADDLAEDPAVIARFMTKLQSLDVAAQTLRKLSDLIP
ncbi:MAG: hypothetical protein V3R15_07245 [Qipengyuania citrea]